MTITKINGRPTRRHAVVDNRPLCGGGHKAKGTHWQTDISECDCARCLKIISSRKAKTATGAMSQEQYLLTCLAEECSELAQAALKAVRFGLDDDYHKEPSKQPRQMIRQEFVDVWAVVRILHSVGTMPEAPSELEHLVQEKIAKVKRFMAYSRERGRLA